MFLKIIKLGWKNVWRNPTRSGVVIVAVLLGIWAGAFISAFFNGMIQDYLQNQLNLSVGHIQITHPRFEDQFNPVYEIPDPDRVLDSLQTLPYIVEIRPQSLGTGLVQSAANSYGATIHGVQKQDDTDHPIQQHLIHGAMFEGVRRNPVVIGNELAERLKVETGNRIVLSFQDVSGSITAAAFRVSGIFDSANNNYDKGNVFVDRENLNSLFGKEGMIHKITLKVDQFSRADSYRRQLSGLFPDLKISSWGEISPELQYVYDMMDVSLYVIMVIIIIALIFSIINTMLMAILERTRELGMLMAVGMNKRRLFSMVLSETFFLTMVGAPVGLLLSWATVKLLADTGIDLSAFARGLNEYGMSSVIYPEMSVAYYLNIALMIAGAALLSSLYPAWKTLKLKPVEAIRKI